MGADLGNGRTSQTKTVGKRYVTGHETDRKKISAYVSNLPSNFGYRHERA